MQGNATETSLRSDTNVANIYRLTESIGSTKTIKYIAETATAIGCSMEEIMQMNIDKLRERYPNGFDPEKSQHRAKGDI